MKITVSDEGQFLSIHVERESEKSYYSVIINYSRHKTIVVSFVAEGASIACVPSATKED